MPDPASPQSFNRYSYTMNNPLKYTDPSGHCVAESASEPCKPTPPPRPSPRHDSRNLYYFEIITSNNGAVHIAVDFGQGPFAFYATAKGTNAGVVLVPIEMIDLEWMGSPEETYKDLEPWELNARNIFAEIHGVISSLKPYATADSIAIAYSPYNRSNSTDQSWSNRTVEEQLLARPPSQYAISYQDTESGEWVMSAAQPSRFEEPEVFQFTLAIALGVDQGYLWDPSFGSMNYAHRPATEGVNGPAHFRNPRSPATSFELLRQRNLIP